MTSVFIDGSAGTTGLRIRQRLEQRKDLQLLSLPEEMRKDESARRECLNRADVAFLCMPDAAAIEAAGMVENSKTVLIDTSTAHRINDGWVYGFPELTGQRERIRNSKRIANPGCHASGFIALAAPLVEKGLLPKDAGLSCFSLTGFSGGGKKMIAEYDSGQEALTAPRMYGLKQNHKHLPETKKHCGLESEPVFCPVVSSYYSGMQVVIPSSPESLESARSKSRPCTVTTIPERLSGQQTVEIKTAFSPLPGERGLTIWRSAFLAMTGGSLWFADSTISEKVPPVQLSRT